MGGGGRGMRASHHNIVVIAPMIKNIGTGVKRDVCYTMFAKNRDVTIITSL